MNSLARRCDCNAKWLIFKPMSWMNNLNMRFYFESFHLSNIVLLIYAERYHGFACTKLLKYQLKGMTILTTVFEPLIAFNTPGLSSLRKLNVYPGYNNLPIVYSLGFGLVPFFILALPFGFRLLCLPVLETIQKIHWDSIYLKYLYSTAVEKPGKYENDQD